MNNEIEAARNIHGRSLKLVAQDIGVGYVTLYKWRNLENLCPKHRRASVERAFRAKIDWVIYEKQFAERQAERHTAAIEAANANLQADVAKIEQSPLLPPETGEKGGFFSFLNIKDDDEDGAWV